MNRLSVGIIWLIAMPMVWVAGCPAQSMDDLNLQVHGYATQGFVYSTNNNWNTTNSSDGSAAWTEAVVNLTAQPAPRMRIGIQARYYVLGNYGNQITLDWAEGDYKFNEMFGVRAGKVKTPMGLLNEIQDIDPANIWVLLPQGVYPLASRNSVLAHYGGVLYGALPASESMGKLEYRLSAGQVRVSADDGYFQPYRDQGVSAPNGLSGPMFSWKLQWKTPIEGLLLGASQSVEKFSGEIAVGPYSGSAWTPGLKPNLFFTRYERKRIMLAGEYARAATSGTFQLAGLPTQYHATDQRSFYVMASCKLRKKLTGGAYYSSAIDRKAASNSGRYEKDWAISTRYDFTTDAYLKIEQHITDGTLRGYSISNNTGGLQPSSRMTLLKLGVSF